MSLSSSLRALALLAVLMHASAHGEVTAQANHPMRGHLPDATFGSFRQPFSASSPWNRRPVDPVLGDYRLPLTRYRPYVGPGPFSSAVFEARADDAPVTVFGPASQPGVWHPDEGAHRPITIARWPADVRPATGSDGHAEIIDAESGIVHSFWQLRLERGVWRASQYAWSALNGRGWPDPAHNHQGARAAGVPVSGGLIRKHEVADGHTAYPHVLAMSLDGSALQRGYVRPATAEDNNAAERYRGGIPMGTLMMLPADFDASALATPALRKIASTLMHFGAAVVDQNDDTRFAIYVEIGADFDLHGKGWNAAAAADLDRIADALRPMLGQRGWLDGSGQPMSDEAALNLLSMRGPWRGDTTSAPRFDSWHQALVFDPSARVNRARQASESAQRLTRWAPWVGGQRYRFSVQADGGARLRLLFEDRHGAVAWDSRELGAGESVEFVMPAAAYKPALLASSGERRMVSWVRGTLVSTEPFGPASISAGLSAKGTRHGP